jgi:hypothetical protein
VATLPPRGPVIADTGSRHGTRVNGERIEGPVLLRHADRVLIGTQLVMVRDTAKYRRELVDTTQSHERPPTHDPKVDTGELDPVAATLVELEEQSEAGATVNLAVVASLLGVLAKRPQPDLGTLQRLSVVALRAAASARSGASEVVDAVVRMHAALGVPMAPRVLDALAVAVARGVELDRVVLLAYVAQLERAVAGRGESDRARLLVERLRRIVLA